mmetsp:Transcript_6577/g.19513  ORF Transcript_6577/g.19513 Transcript_6577/m.19513 type:complete len:256 (-) Transcript_6577:373-1140(-)
MRRLASSWNSRILTEKASALPKGFLCRGYSSAMASSARRSPSTSACTSATEMPCTRSRASRACSWRASRLGSGLASSWRRTASAMKWSRVRDPASPPAGAVGFTAASFESTSSLKPWAPALKPPAFMVLPTRSTVASTAGRTGSATTESAASVMARTEPRASSTRPSKLSRVAKHSSRSAMRGTCARRRERSSSSPSPRCAAVASSPAPLPDLAPASSARASRRFSSSSVGRQSRRRSTSSAAVKTAVSSASAAS